MTTRIDKPISFFKCVVLFVDLCVLRGLSSSIKHGHKPACRQAGLTKDHTGHEGLLQMDSR